MPLHLWRLGPLATTLLYIQICAMPSIEYGRVAEQVTSGL